MSERLLHTAAVRFEAARRLPDLPAGHRARGLHGHGFAARVTADLPPGWGGFDGAETDALTAALAEAVAPLDYADLNERLAVPGDAQLARWVARRLSDDLDVPGLCRVGVQSTPAQGADLALDGACETLEHWRRFRFEAAHQLPKVAPGHPCGRMHGHGFEVVVHAAEDAAAGASGGASVTGPAPSERLQALWAPHGAELDHACLNDIPGLENPTSELLAHWLWQRLAPQLPVLTRISVHETETAGCRYDGTRYRIWKDQRFEAALRLAPAPDGDRRRRLHGHSYGLRLHLGAPLDEVLGWTLDYGDVKALFAPVYARLDHRALDELPHLSAPSPARLACWIREEAAGALPQLERIDLTETPGCGASLRWGGMRGADP
jgi:6-pyruvoyltetrahydropterin/6-carboxytetrahydropterin synthase